MKNDKQAAPLALVTGGGRGIGRAICIELSCAGYAVAVNFLANREAAKETLSAIESNGGSGRLCGFDVTDAQATKSAIAELVEEYGAVSVLVNNAGIAADGLFAMMSQKDWSSVLSTSLDGFFNTTRPALKSMLRKREGSIVTISSVSGVSGNRGQVNYSAAKAGLIGASRALAKEVGRLGIRVNVVAPGLIDTEMSQDAPREMIREMIPLNRLGRPEEVAKAVRFLCSDDAAYITGEVLSVNGGLL